MFQKLIIDGFRCFREMEIPALSRLNLITGRNNSGKTALLEALWLLARNGDPVVTQGLNMFRGVDKLPPDPEEFWGWLFRLKAIPGRFEIWSKTTRDIDKALTATLEPPNKKPESVRVNRNERTPVSAFSTGLEGKLQYRAYAATEGRFSATRSWIGPQGPEMQYGEQRDLVPAVFLSSVTRVFEQDVEMYSRLEETKQADEVLRGLKLLDPRVRRIAILNRGGLPMIAIDVGLERLIPLQFLGEGATRVFSLVTGLVSAKGGIALLDEIENGLHHSALESIWGLLAQLAKDLDVQVFATTHSYECIRAAQKALAHEPGLLTVHRLAIVNERVQAFTFDDEALDVAMKEELEVR
jgi:AAA domain, putative AbiEii toxin, Type IV TA system/AAA domain